MIELFKMIKGIYDPMCIPCVNLGNYQMTWLGLGEIDINLLNITVIMI